MSEVKSDFSNDATSGNVTAVQLSHTMPKKRPPTSDAELHQRKIKRIRERLQLGSPMESNAIMILNEYDKDLKYELVQQIGPVHSPCFTVKLVVNGQVFSGMSSSKKKAKLQAAESAVHALLGEPPDLVASTPARVSMETDVEDLSSRGTNPTVVLNLLRPGTTYTPVVPDDPAETVISNGKPVYGMVCEVDGQRFEGCATNKKMSKALAADAALRKLFGIMCTLQPDGCPVFTGDMASIKQKFFTSPAAHGRASRPVIPAPNLLVDLPGGKNPLSLLHELYSGTDLMINDDLTSETPGVFNARVRIEQQDFNGQGTNKKAARTAAATAAVNYLHESGLLNAKLTAKEMKRRSQTPWQPKQRPHFSQSADKTGTKPISGQGRGRGRGRGRIVARNQSWVSGGVLKASDFLGLAPQNTSQFAADDGYSQLAETARNFAAASANMQGYEMYGDYQSTSAQQSTTPFAQQGQSQKRGGSNSSSSMFTAYGGYTSRAGTSQVQTSSQAGGERGRGRGRGTRGGAGAAVGRGTGTSVSQPGGATAYRSRYGISTDLTGYGTATTPVMQSANQPLTADQYATAITADSYTSVAGTQHLPQQQIYETYPGYEYADAAAAAAAAGYTQAAAGYSQAAAEYSQTAYYTGGGDATQYVTTDATLAQYYSQF